jgi:hypothetical protein
MKSIENKNNNCTISRLQVGLIFFLAFHGLLVVVWCILAIFGYPVFSRSGYFTALPMCYVFVPFYAYIIFRQVQIGGFRSFTALSFPFLLLFGMVTVRHILDVWYLSSSPIVGQIRPIVFFVMVCAFAAPITYCRYSIRTAFYNVYIPVGILVLLSYLSFYQNLFAGLTLRNGLAPDSYSRIVFDSMFNHRGVLLDIVSKSGSVFALMSLFALKRCWIRLPLFFPTFTLGTILMVYGAFVQYTIAFLTTFLFLFVVFPFWRSRKDVLLFVLCITIILLSIFLVGCNSQHSLMQRFYKKVEMTKQSIIVATTDLPTNKISDKITDLPANKLSDKTTDLSVKEISDSVYSKVANIVVRNPYSKKIYRGKDNGEGIKGNSLLVNYLNIKNSRIALWLCAIESIRIHPFLGSSFFLVLDNKKLSSEDNNLKLTVHSNILTIFMGIGIIGGLLFLFYLCRCFFDIFVIFRYNPDYGWLAVLFMFNVVANLFSIDVVYEPSLWIPLVIMRSLVKSSYSKLESTDVASKFTH